MTRPNTADSRDTNVKYIAAVAKILHANAEAAAEGWTEVALLVNKAPDSQKVSTYAALERGSEHFDDWLPPSAWDELGKVLAAWQFELTQQGHPKWTAMFLGGVADNQIRGQHGDHGGRHAAGRDAGPDHRVGFLVLPPGLGHPDHRGGLRPGVGGDPGGPDRPGPDLPAHLRGQAGRQLHLGDPGHPRARDPRHPGRADRRSVAHRG